MKSLTLYLHPGAEHAALDALRSSPRVSGFTVVRGEGHSSRAPDRKEQAASDLVAGFVPSVQIEVHLPTADVDAVLATVRGSLGPSSQGVFTVTPIVRSGAL